MMKVVTLKREGEKKIELDPSPDEDDIQSSKWSENSNVHPVDNVAVSDELEVRVWVEKTTTLADDS